MRVLTSDWTASFPLPQAVPADIKAKTLDPCSGVFVVLLPFPLREGQSAPMKCPYCQRPLIKIDYYGEPLIGCIKCNRWGRPGDKTLIMELLEDDLEALREARTSVREGTRR